MNTKCPTHSRAMADILRKFPRSVGERWHDHLSIQSHDVKAKAFPVLIAWLISRKETWEGMATVDVGRSRRVKTHYSERSEGTGKRACFKCGEEGHLQRSCPKNNRDNTRDNSKKKEPRKAPKIKKHWCALHKGDPSKRCFSDACQKLCRTEL